MNLSKEQILEGIKDRIESEHRKHSQLDWARIAAGKIYLGFIEPILEKNMNIDLLNYDAKTASADANRVDESELIEVLTNIQKEALQGKTELWVYKPLKHNTKMMLEAKGFWVETQPGIATQRDGIYYQIKW
jgi:hypothetical protein